MQNLPDNPYFLLTPGPLSTSKTVKAAMLRDWCTWDDDYNQIVQNIRQQLVTLAEPENPAEYTSILMQGSGTFAVESVISSVIPKNGKLLVIANGTYGQRIATIAKYLQIPTIILDSGETSLPDLNLIENTLKQHHDLTHVAVVHCETTTGILNPIESIGQIVKKYARTYIVDAMSTFGGIPIAIDKIQADFLISSANKCIEGVPGFGFIIAKKSSLIPTKNFARSLSLDLYDQWHTMEQQNGKWRFTSPTHVVRAFAQALQELANEGGINARYQRYCQNHKTLVSHLADIGFETLLPPKLQSPIITSF
ncbi:MAG: 2-aminoethylphosphonate--pyruvate transaminase, partial [Lentisphaeria bacterium]